MLANKKEKSPQFSEGEMVRVKSQDRILKSIDEGHKLDGCLFMEQMWNYCGKTYPVSKIVNYYFSERKKRTFKPRSALYTLHDLFCDGKVDKFPSICNRSCFLLWHEDWLEKTQ